MNENQMDIRKYPKILSKKNYDLKILKHKYQKEKDLVKKIQYIENYITEYDSYWFEFIEMNTKVSEVYENTISDNLKINTALLDEIVQYKALAKSNPQACIEKLLIKGR